MTNKTDSYYIQRILEGDANSFAPLVATYKDMVFSLAVKMLQDREEAEEVAQDTFVKAYRYLPKYRGDAKFSTWLYRIAYNACMDHLKKRAKVQHHISMDELADTDLQTTENVLVAIDKAERSQLIKKGLNQLPNQDKSLLVMYYISELSIKEIAAVVGILENAAKVKLHRARKKFLTVLQNKEFKNIRQYENF